MQFNGINANTQTHIIHQLNINKCTPKQYHEMTIEHLSLFVWWVDSFLILMSLQEWLESSASSSSSLTTASFLIQMLIWIRGSSWVESFWIRVHIPYRLRNILWIVRSWSLVAPIFSSLVMNWDSSCVHSPQSLLKVINFLLAHIQCGHNNIFFLFGFLKFFLKLSNHSSTGSSMSFSDWCHFLWTTSSKHWTLPLLSSRMIHEGCDYP